LFEEKLSVRDVSSSYIHNGRLLPVLEAISIHVKEGEFVSLLGPSGSGKSTLLKIIAGLIKPDAGSIFLNGKEIKGTIMKMGYMPQKDLLLPWKPLLYNAALPLLAQGTGKKEAYNKVRELLPVFGLEGFENSYPAQLSGGMRQRAALLRTVLIDSEVMLLDEPFGALDALTRERLQEWMLSIWDHFKRSVLFVTHSIDEAIYLSDRIYMISELPGKIVLEESINLPRPRARKIVLSPLFTEYKQSLMTALANETTWGKME